MKLCLPFLITFYMVSVITDPIDKVAELIRRGNISELSKMFASTVEITIQDEENAYSKVQAGLILNKFFEQNKPTSVKMLHKVNSNPKYLFGVLIVTTPKGPFRIAYTLKETDDGLVLIEMRIESAK